MKVLVTGATGFLGQKTALRLQEEGFTVTGLGRNTKAGQALEKQGIRFARIDLSSREAESLRKLHEAVAGHDFVIHCAALSSPWGQYEEFYNANVVGTENILAAARKAGVKRLVHVSTPSLYVDRVSRVNIRESDPLPETGINYYSQTKLMAEDRVDQATREGLATVTIRPQGIIGPGDSAILPRLLKMAQKGVLPVIGDGDCMIDLTYVDNVVEALVCAMRAPDSAIGRKYNITNGEPVNIYSTLEGLFQALGFTYKKKNLSFGKAYAIAATIEFVCRNFLRSVEPILTRYNVCLLGRSRTLNIEAARRELGYEPRVPLQVGLERIIEDYRASSGAR